MTGIQIILGERWAGDRGIVGRLRAHGRGEQRFDFADVRDVVDIFVDGANVGAAAQADAVACLARDLLTALVRLQTGEALKVAVPFYESSFELVLQRAGEPPLPPRRLPAGRPRRTPRRDVDLNVTFFRGGPAPELLLRNHEAGLRELARTVAAAASKLSARLVRLDRSLAGDAFVRELRSLAERVLAPSEPPPPLEIPARVPLASRSWNRWADRHLARLVFQGEAEWSDLLGPALPDRTDLSALLFQGELAVWDSGRRRSIGRGHPFLLAERLLDVARHVLEARDGRRVPAALRFRCDGLWVGTRPEAGDAVALTFAETVGGGEPVVVRFADPESLAGAVLALAAEMRRVVLAVAPEQRRNLRLEAFAAELRQLAAWRQDLASQALVNDDPGSYRIETRGEEDEDEARPPAPLLVGEPRRMRYVERWHLEAGALDLSATFLCGDRLLVATGDALLAVDRDSGEVLWRQETPPVLSAGGTATALMAGGRGVVRVSPSGKASLLDLRTGDELWSTRIRPPAGPVTGVTVGSAKSPHLIVLSEGGDGNRGLVALDANTGEARWRFASRRSAEDAAFRFVRAGRLLLTVCGDSAVYAIDGDTGGVVWRFTDRVRFVRPPRLARDTVLAVGGETSRRGAALYALDAFTGRPLWQRPLPGVALGEPAACRNVALVATVDPEGQGRPGITAVETTTGTPLWRRQVAGLDRGFAWLPVDERVVVNVAGGHALALDSATGDVAWEHRPGPEAVADQPLRLEPVLRGAALFLPMDAVYVLRPGDGEVVHRLQDGLVPDWLRVDERCHLFVGEQSGHLAAYGIAARLAVVK